MRGDDSTCYTQKCTAVHEFFFPWWEHELQSSSINRRINLSRSPHILQANRGDHGEQASHNIRLQLSKERHEVWIISPDWVRHCALEPVIDLLPK